MFAHVADGLSNLTGTIALSCILLWLAMSWIGVKLTVKDEQKP